MADLNLGDIHENISNMTYKQIKQRAIEYRVAKESLHAEWQVQGLVEDTRLVHHIQNTLKISFKSSKKIKVKKQNGRRRREEEYKQERFQLEKKSLVSSQQRCIVNNYSVVH